MSEMRPSYEERDRYLDQLATAYAQGRIDDSQFAGRSDEILQGETLGDLDKALQGIAVAPAYVPRPAEMEPVQPYRPVPSSLYGAPPAQRGDYDRRQLLAVGGIAAFVVIIGGIAVSSARFTVEQPRVVWDPGIPAGEMPGLFAPGMQLHEVLSPHLTDTIGSIEVTSSQAEVRAEYAPPDGWMQRTVASDSSWSGIMISPVTDTFSPSEINFDLTDVLTGAQGKFPEFPIDTVRIVRAKDGVVQMIVKMDNGSTSVWNAQTHAFISEKPA